MDADRLITVAYMAKRYGCSLPTARKYIRQCVPHLEDPLVTYPWALREWEERRTVIPAETSRKIRQEIQRKQRQGRVIVPRTREG